MSFKLKTILGIAFIEGILLLLLIFFGINYFYEDQNKALNKRAQTIVNVFANMASDSVITSDLASLESFAVAILQNPDIRYVKIFDEFGSILVAQGDEKVLSVDFVSDTGLASSEVDGVFDIKEQIVIDEQNFGRVELGISTTELLESIELATKNAAYIAILEMVLVALFSFVLGTFLTRQLLTLEKAAKKISAGDLGYTIEIESNDEIGRLATSFNQMSLTVKNLYQAESGAREKAERASKVKSEFLSTMSHEIRTPMNGVFGMLHILNDTKLDLQQQKLLNTARGSGEMLLAIINDILDFSKMEADKLVLETIPVDITSIMEDSAILLAGNAADKKLELICDIAPNLPALVLGDPTRIRQVITNFISNSIKFTEKGEIVLHANRTSKGIRFSVTDTGIGMTDEQQKSIFTAFSQADNTTTRKYGGTGLGLAICLRLVNKMGGDISLTSTFGEGTCFSFELPLEIVDESVLENMSEKLPTQNILIVDDNETNLDVLTMLFESWGVNRITKAATGEEALAKYEAAIESNEPFDICILDMQMPGLNGLQVAEIIKKTGLHVPHLVMLSSIEGDKNSDVFDVWLAKPVRQRDLYTNLLYILGERENNTSETKKKQKLLPNFKNKRVLVVDDNAINIAVAEALLEKVGFTVDSCLSGEQSIHAVQVNVFDLVIMDIQMPGISGYEACKQIRNLGDGFSDLPIIAITANAMVEDKEACLAAGMDDHIAKPIDPSILYATLAKFLQVPFEPIDKNSDSPDIDRQSAPTISGIDIATGLDRLKNDWDLYKKLLIDFRDNKINREFIDTIRKQVTENDFEAAAILAHTLKGTSGNLSISTIFDEASILENFCKNKSLADIELSLEKLNTPLQQLFADLSVLTETPALEQGKSAICNLSTQQIESTMISLIDYIESDLTQIELCTNDLSPCMIGSEMETVYNGMLTAIDRFELDDAKACANKVLEILKHSHIERKAG